MSTKHKEQARLLPGVHMKVCGKCKVDKDVEEFPRNSSRKDGRGSTCKVCHRVYVKKHYDSNKQYYVDKAQRNKRVVQQRVRELKDVPCYDCGNSYPYYVMDFDHRPEHDKVLEMNRACDSGWQKVLAETEKCDVVCSNCHRIRTHNRQALVV